MVAGSFVGYLFTGCPYHVVSGIQPCYYWGESKCCILSWGCGSVAGVRVPSIIFLVGYA